MIEKEMAIRILDDIRRCLNAEDNAQQLTLSSIRQYKTYINRKGVVKNGDRRFIRTIR